MNSLHQVMSKCITLSLIGAVDFKNLFFYSTFVPLHVHCEVLCIYSILAYKDNTLDEGRVPCPQILPISNNPLWCSKCALVFDCLEMSHVIFLKLRKKKLLAKLLGPF